MSKDFGKDLGLLHEMVITGRKAGMTREAYAFLAEGEEFFAKVASLVRHAAVLEREGVPATPVDEGEILHLIDEMRRITQEGCLSCTPCGTEEGWNIFLSFCFGPEADKKYEEYFDHQPEFCPRDKDEAICEFLRNLEVQDLFRDRVRIGLMIWLETRLREIGIHPKELVEFSPAYKWVEENQRLIVDQVRCIDFEPGFAKVLRMLTWQRNVLATLATK